MKIKDSLVRFVFFTVKICTFYFFIHIQSFYRITGRNLSELKTEIDRKTAALVGLCKKIGIKTKNITSAEVSIRPQYNYQTRTFLGYDVSRNVSVILKDLAAAQMITVFARLYAVLIVPEVITGI